MIAYRRSERRAREDTIWNVAIYLDGGVRLEAAEGAGIEGELLEVNDRGMDLATPNTELLGGGLLPWHVIQVIQLDLEIEPGLPDEQEFAQHVG